MTAQKNFSIARFPDAERRGLIFVRGAAGGKLSIASGLHALKSGKKFAKSHAFVVAAFALQGGAAFQFRAAAWWFNGRAR